MKVFFFIFFIVTTTAIHAQQDKNLGEPNSKADKNLATARVVLNAFRSGDTSEINSVVAVDFIDHTERGDLGRDSLKAMIVMMHKQFPDMKAKIIKELADKDYVFSLIKNSGVSKGEMGMPPGPYEMTSMEVIRFANGKIVEHWSYMDIREIVKLMPQMGK
jgi:predicted SnoaL-like aldol condensation-catalyzing enzyme